MKKLFIIIAIVFCFLHISLIADAKVIPDEELSNIKRDIISLNLLNALYLSDQQLKQYLNILKKCQSYENDAKNLYNKYQLTQINAYKNLKRELANNSTPSKQVLIEARRVNNKGKFYNNSFREKIYKCEEELKSILNDNQLSIVSNFKPCLIPRRDLIDPSRVGQANSSKGIEKMLTRARNLPQSEYYRLREYFFYNKYIDKYEKHVKKLTDSEKAQEKSRFYSILNQARNLSDVDFEIQKQQLAESLKPPERKHDRNLKKNQLSLLGKILLNTNLIPIIEQRIGH